MAINPVMMQYGDEKFPEIYSDYKSLKILFQVKVSLT